jgi:predicted AlkP superfamily pyrophosphatase or phosphodiesterase
LFKHLESDLFLPNYKRNISTTLNNQIKHFFDNSDLNFYGNNISYANCETLLVFIIDGLGIELSYSDYFKENFKEIGSWISSTYPTITPTAMSSIFSGLTPGQHGITGHQLPWLKTKKFQQIANDVNFSWLDYDFSDSSNPFLDRGEIKNINEPQFFLYGQINPLHPSYGIIPMLFGKKIRTYINLRELKRKIIGNMKSVKQKKVIVIYSMLYDIYCHFFGKTSSLAKAEIFKWGKFIQDLKQEIKKKKLSSTHIIVTADHGHKRANIDISLSRSTTNVINEISSGVGKSGRTLHFYPKIGQEDKLVKILNSNWAKYGQVIRPGENKEILGNYTSSLAIERVGAVNFVPFENYSPKWGVVYGWFNNFLDYFKKYFPSTEHGGLSREELTTPFFFITQ